MTSSLLFEHFATLATAPEGIPRLRELILQLAVQGKLGTQDPGDEPAGVLLERIRKEKERVPKAEKNKKEKSFSKINAVDVNFQVPKSWVITRLGEIAQYNAEIKVSASEVSDDAWILDLEDIEKDASRILQKLRYKERQSLSSKSRFLKGDVLYGKLRPYLNKVVVADEDGYCTTEIVPIRPYGNIFPKYLMYALKTPDFLDYVNSKTYGIKMPRLGTTDALNTIISLPPLAEQHRIVEKVDRLMALCDELEARQQQERAGSLRLGTASLAGLQNAVSPEEFERRWAQVCEAFEVIFDCPENVGTLRQTILQLAVQGKFGTNNPKELPIKIDESTKRSRKIKSKNGDSNKIQIIDIFSPNLLQKNWIKTTLNSVGIWSTGGTPSRQIADYFDGGIPWIKSGDLNDGIVTETDETISQSGLENSNAKLLPKGTISIALYGATIGKLGILGIEATTNQACANCVINEKIVISRYLFYFLQSQKRYLIEVGQGGAQPNITNWIIWEWPIVIPPLAEQHRIVAKVDALMGLCDALESRLKERAEIQTKFSNSIVKSIGSG